MTSLLKGLLLTCLAFTMAACSQSSSKNDKTQTYKYRSDNEAIAATKSWVVSCEDKSKCPESVAQLVVAVDDSVSVCTATLIAEDKVVTNSHCFSWEPYRDPNAICKNAVLVFASESAKGRQVVKCEEVLAKSDISGGKMNRPDFMILKVEKVKDRKFETIDPRGLEDGLKLQAKTVNPYGRGYGSLIVKDCEIVHGTFLDTQALKNDSPVHIMKNCDVIHGNSGSSLFDSKGQLRGLVFATVNQNAISRIKLPTQMLNVIRNTKPSFAVNGACIDWDQSGKLNGECKVSTAEIGATDPEDLKKFQDDLLPEYNSLVQSENRFGYEVSKPIGNDFEKAILVYPSCVRNLESVKKLIARSPNLNFVAKVLRISIKNELSDRLKMVFNKAVTPAVCTFNARVKSGDELSLEVSSYTENCLPKKSPYDFFPRITLKACE